MKGRRTAQIDSELSKVLNYFIYHLLSRRLLSLSKLPILLNLSHRSLADEIFYLVRSSVILYISNFIWTWKPPFHYFACRNKVPVHNFLIKSCHWMETAFWSRGWLKCRNRKWCGFSMNIPLLLPASWRKKDRKSLLSASSQTYSCFSWQVYEEVWF